MSLLAQDERLTRRVGAIALGLIAAAIVFFVFLWDRIEIGTPTRIKVYFHHSAGLREHAALIVGGREVGHIEAIENVGHGQTTVLGGEAGTVAVIAIEDGEAWKVPADAVVFVASHGPLSAKYLEVAPPKRDAPPGPSIQEGAELRGIDPPSLDNVLNRSWTNMNTFRAFAEQIRPEMAALRTQVAALRTTLDSLAPPAGTLGLWVEAQGLIAEAKKVRDVGLGGDFGLAAFRSTIATARSTLAQTRAALARLEPLATALSANVTRAKGAVEAHDPVGRIASAIAQARTVLDKVDPLLAKVDDINGRLARGEGSLGLLMHDPEFPEDAKELGKILKRQPWKVIAKPKDN